MRIGRPSSGAGVFIVGVVVSLVGVDGDGEAVPELDALRSFDADSGAAPITAFSLMMHPSPIVIGPS